MWWTNPEYSRVSSRIINISQLLMSHWLEHSVAQPAGCKAGEGKPEIILPTSIHKSELLQSLIISNFTEKLFNTADFKSPFIQTMFSSHPDSLFWVPSQINSSLLRNQPHPGKQHFFLQAVIVCLRIWTCISVSVLKLSSSTQNTSRILNWFHLWPKIRISKDMPWLADTQVLWCLN